MFLLNNRAVGSNPRAIQIKYGATAYKNGIKVNVKRVVNHNQFNRQTIDYDFALLELQEAIELDETAKPIKLTDTNERLVDGSTCLVTGWGNTQNAVESRYRLRGAEVPIVQQTQCAKAYRRYGGITARMLCAGFQRGGKDGKTLAFCERESFGC